MVDLGDLSAGTTYLLGFCHPLEALFKRWKWQDEEGKAKGGRGS